MGEPATVVVTGASSGIGAAAALELAGRGMRVVAVGRDPERLEKVGRKVDATVRADLSTADGVRALAAELLERCPRIEVLVNNAGVVMGQREVTADGHETTMAVNHFAPFLLTNLLRARLRESAPARVITTSSDAHYRGRLDLDDLDFERRWSSWGAYCASKLANVLFTRELAARADSDDLVAHCLHPGVIRTRLFRQTRGATGAGLRAASLFFAGADTGAQTIVHLATSPDAGELSGLYWSHSHPTTPSDRALDDALAAGLWERSAARVGL